MNELDIDRCFEQNGNIWKNNKLQNRTLNPWTFDLKTLLMKQQEDQSVADTVKHAQNKALEETPTHN